MRRVTGYLRQAYSGLPATVWLLALVNLINRSGTMVLPFLPLYVHEELGFSVSFAGTAVGVYGIGALFGSWLGGRLCDRFSAYSVIVAFLVGAGAAMLLVAQMRQTFALIASLAFLGCIAEGVRPATGVLLTALCPVALRPRGFSLVRLAVNLGTSVGPALGGFLALKSYAWLFRVDALTCMTAALPLVLLPHGRAIRAGEGARVRAAGVSARRDGVYLVFLGMVLLTGIMFVQIWSTYPLFLAQEFGLDTRRYGLLMSCNGVLIITCEMALTHYFASWRPLRVVCIGLVLFAVGLAMLPFGAGFVYAVISVAVWTTGEMLIAPFLSTFVSLHAPPGRVGHYMGLYNMAWAGAFVAAPPLGAWTYEHHGGTVLWIGAALLGLVGSVVSLFLDQTVKKTR